MSPQSTFQFYIFISLLVCHSFTITEPAISPYIIEQIIPFNLQVDDIQYLSKKQLSANNFKTPSFSADNTTVGSLKYKSYYNGSEKIISPNQSSHHTVSRDCLDLQISYSAHIKGIRAKTYSCTTKIKVYFGYEKKINQNGTIQFPYFSIAVDKSTIQITTTKQPTKAHLKKLQEINNGSSVKISILSLLKTQEFTQKQILSFVKENAKEEHISITYPKFYNYSFDKIHLNYQLSSVAVEDIQNGIRHTLKALPTSNRKKIKGTIKSSIKSEKAEFHTLFTTDFLYNFIDSCLEKLKNVQFEKTRVRTRNFRFRLLDLEEVFPQLLTNHSESYLKEISVSCATNNFNSFTYSFASFKIKVEVPWNCNINLGASKQPILPFNITVLYDVSIFASDQRILTQITDVYLKGYQTGEVKVSNQQLAEAYIEQVFYILMGYTIGTNFIVKGESTKIQVQSEGVFVG